MPSGWGDEAAERHEMNQPSEFVREDGSVLNPGPMPEPAGLWAVISFTPTEHPELLVYLVRAPGLLGNSYWYELGSENGWGWDRIIQWGGTVRLVRAGAVEPRISHSERTTFRKVGE